MTAARRVARWALDWEDWLSFGLAYLAFLSVAWSIQQAHWADTMPSLVLLGLGGLLAGWLLARLPLAWPLAWAVGLVWGLLATFLQALFLVPGADLGEKVDVLHTRFQRYFEVVFSGGISNDALPFVVLVAGLTFGGAFLLSWCLFRWHTAWPGLVLGGATLLVNFVVLDREVLGAFLLFAIAGLLLVARANLMGHVWRWRREGVEYPALLGPAHLHLAFWVVLALLMVAWVVPTSYGRPLGQVWGAVSAPFRGLADDWARLVGPLTGGRVPRGVDLAQVLPLRGGLGLPSEGELVRVRLPEGAKPVPILLRATVYEDYALGGWKAGDRLEVDWPFTGEGLPPQVAERALATDVEVVRGGPVASLLLVPGQPLPVAFAGEEGPLRAKALVPKEAVRKVNLDGGPYGPEDQPVLSVLTALGPDADDATLRQALLQRGYLLLRAKRKGGRIGQVEVVPLEALVASATFVPDKALPLGTGYRAMGVVPAPTTEDLARAVPDYPEWVKRVYLALPESLPRRVVELARQVARRYGDSPMDKVRAIREMLQGYPVDMSLEVPPGRDAVDYFLFEARRGPVELHASAMVVMLRAVGVPARLAVGLALSPADYDEEVGAYRATAAQAMAWPEVYFPPWGWIPFEPVEGTTTAFNVPYQYGLPVPVGLFGPLGPESDILQEIIGAPEPPSGGTSAQGGEGGGHGLPVLPWALLGVAAALALAVGGVRLAWERPLARLPEPERLWEKTVRLAAWAGLGPRPGETPYEFARRLGRALPGFGDLDPLARCYCASRYGRRAPPSQAMDYVRRLWPHLRGALLAQILRRPWRQGRL